MTWRPSPGTDPRQPEWRRLGEILQRARERAELSMVTVSVKSNQSPTYYGMLERGQRRPSATLLLKLFRVLDVKKAEQEQAWLLFGRSLWADAARAMPHDVRTSVTKRLFRDGV